MKTLTLILLGVLWGGMALPSHALLVGVYTLPGDSLSVREAAGLVASVRENNAVPTGGRYAVKVSDSLLESSQLTPEFSVPEGVSAFFWSDLPYEYAGFEMHGTQALFESGIDKLAELRGDSAADSGGIGAKTTGMPIPIPWKTEFQDALLDSKQIQLHFTLSEPGRVSVEVYGMDGRAFGRWNWEETSPGQYQRAFELNRATQGTVLVRWTYGDIQVIRKVTRSEKPSR